MFDWMSLVILGFLYIAPLVILCLKIGHIKHIVKDLKASPKDVSDLLTRGLALLILYYVIVGIVVLTLAQKEIGTVMSSLLFAMVGWVFGLFTPRPFQK